MDPQHDMPPPVASIDIGSNSVLLLVARRTADGRWHTLHEAAEITRISEGLDASGSLADAPVGRTADVLRAFAATCRDLGVARIHATGTAPFRRSTNGPDVAAALGQALGAPLHIASGTEEAELSLLATTRAFPDLPDLLVLDIGGASTELILHGPHRTLTRSLDIGSVRLSERFDGHLPLPNHRQRALRAAVLDALRTADILPHIPTGIPLVGIAGTVTTLLAASLRMDRWDASRVHGASLDRDTLLPLLDTLCRLDAAGRAELPGIAPKRADVIAAGALLLDALMEALQAPTLRVSDRGVRWGRLHREEDP